MTSERGIDWDNRYFFETQIRCMELSEDVAIYTMQES